MAIVIKPITVEVSKPNVFQAIAAKQNDSNSRFLKVTFVNEGEKIYVPPSARVTINAERTDGKSNSFFGEVNNDGTVTVPIHSWILELPGYVNCDVSIIEADSKLTSTTFTLLVEEASHGSGDVSDEEQYDFLTEVVKMVAKSKNEVASAIPNTTSGTAIALTDISPLEHILRVKAKSKNIIPYPYYETTKTLNGIKFTDNGDCSISVDKTANDNAYFTLVSKTAKNLYLEKGQTYTLNVLPVSGSYSTIYAYLIESDGTEHYELVDSVTFTANSSGYASISFVVAKGFVADNLLIKPQFEEGSVATPYAPYVEDVSTANVLKYGKNIIPYPYYTTTNSHGITYNIGEDGRFVANGITTTGTNFYFAFTLELAPATYTYSYKGTISADNEVYLFIHSLTTQQTLAALTPTKKETTFTITEEMTVRVYLNIPLAGVNVNCDLYPQLELGTIKTPYTAYTEPTTHKINADGTVEGVTSLYPTTTLISDTEGVVLDVNYNVDTKKYIDNKFAELAALIVNS